MFLPHHYYYKLITEDNKIVYARVRDPLRNRTQASFKTGTKVKEFYPSGLIPYFWERFKTKFIKRD